MWSADVAARWRELGDEVIMGMAEWRGRTHTPPFRLRETSHLEYLQRDRPNWCWHAHEQKRHYVRGVLMIHERTVA